MKAVVVVDSPQGKTLQVREVAAPVPGPGQVLVHVHAAALNRSDLSRTQKHYAPRPVHIAGNEMSGEVIALGPGVTRFAPGDRVMALADGSYAEQVCVDEDVALRVPDALPLLDAAAVPVSYLTAHDALRSAGHLAGGESVLIHSVTSGVGIAAVQIARVLGAGLVMGSTRRADRAEPLRAHGLQEIVDLARAPDFSRAVLEKTGGQGTALILDAIGGGVLAQNLAAAAVRGRIVVLGMLGGTEDTLDLNLLALRRLQLIGVSFRSRSLAERAQVCRRFEAELGPRLADGTLRPVISRTFPLDEALQAQEFMRGNLHLGKIVLLL